MSIVTKDWKFCPKCTKPLTTTKVEGRDKVACPDGHFVFHDNPLPVVAALVVTETGVVLVQRSDEYFYGRWCLPRGFIETDEKPKQAVAREIREETGFHVWLKRILCFTNPSPENYPLNQVTTTYLAVVRGGELQAGSDALDAKIFPWDQLPDICFDNDRQIIAEWIAGHHGTIDKPSNFRQRSTFTLPGETRSTADNRVVVEERQQPVEQSSFFAWLKKIFGNCR
jgi:ADP-ribose pyrophosphatase YjhB (NUDIX family)